MLRKIQKGDYLLLTDIEDTKEYYQNQTLCECPNCRNYYAQIKGKFPELEAFLEEFGIDVEKPDEIESVDRDDHLECIWIDYTVSGRMEAIDRHKVAYEEQLELKLDNFPATIVISEHFIFPNEREGGECFAVSIKGLSLPWVLVEDQLSSPALAEKYSPKKSGTVAKLKAFFVNIKKSK